MMSGCDSMCVFPSDENVQSTRTSVHKNAGSHERMNAWRHSDRVTIPYYTAMADWIGVPIATPFAWFLLLLLLLLSVSSLCLVVAVGYVSRSLWWNRQPQQAPCLHTYSHEAAEEWNKPLQSMLVNIILNHYCYSLYSVWSLFLLPRGANIDFQVEKRRRTVRDLIMKYNGAAWHASPFAPRTAKRFLHHRKLHARKTPTSLYLLLFYII